MKPLATTLDPLAYPVPQAAEVIGVSESTMWRLIRDGEVVALKIRGCTVIRRGQLLKYLRATEARQRSTAPTRS